MLRVIGLGVLIVGLAAPVGLAQDWMRPDAPPPPFPRAFFGPAEMRGRMLESLHEQLAMTDDEFAALTPKIDAVMRLQHDVEARPMMGGPRGGPPGPGGPQGMLGPQGGPNDGPPPPPGANDDQRPAAAPRGDDRPPMPPQSDVQSALRDLHHAIDIHAAPNVLKEKLDAFRAAKAKALDDLAKAQDELKNGMTDRQETILVAAGLLN